MNKQMCKKKPFVIDRALSLQSHSGAKSRLNSMQGRAERAEGKPCQGYSKSGIPLLGRFGDTQYCHQTASKYNGGLLDKKDFKFIVGLDYLTLNLNGAIPIEVDEYELTTGDFKFMNTETPTQHFRTIFNVYHLDNLLGTILAYPRQGNKLKPDTIQLNIENQNFYDDTALLEIIEKFINQFSIKFKNITRADVYLDSYGFQRRITLNQLDYFLDEGYLTTNTRVKDKSKTLCQS